MLLGNRAEPDHPVPRPERATAVAITIALLIFASCASESSDRTEPVDTSDLATATHLGRPWLDIPGVDEGSCADVDSIVAAADPGQPVSVRSGTIIAGSFADLEGAGTRGETDFVAKISWEPSDPDGVEGNPLTVVATHADMPDGLTTVIDQAAYSRGWFWASGIELPRAGRWRLTATARGFHGCFDVTV